MKNNLIFDVGMHAGEDTEYYLKRGFSVVAIEADPELAANGDRRFATDIESGRLTIVNKAIAEGDGPMTFYRCENMSIWGTTRPNWAERNARLGGVITESIVDGVTFASILDAYGCPYYLKIDIEGADLICLESFLSRRERPKFISLEASKVSLDELHEEFRLFEELGYRRFKIVGQHKIERQRPPHGVEHAFQAGCSGLCSWELPGTWLSREQAFNRYRRIFRRYRLMGDASPIRRSLTVDRTSPHSLIAGVVKAIKRAGKHVGLQPGWYDTHAMYTGHSGLAEVTRSYG